MPVNDDFDVIVIEDEDDVRLGCLQALALEGLRAKGFDSVESVPQPLPRDGRFVVVSDIRLPGLDGMAYLRQLAEWDADVPVILITGHGDVQMAVQSMRDGAYDFIQKPFQSHELVAVVKRALDKRALALEVRRLRRQVAVIGGLENRIIGRSPAIVELRELVQALAPLPTDVMILGETGTGKELVARCLHDLSGRKGPFVALNCGGLPETLFESEIFGHEAGSFSGATKQRIGKIEFAHGGTLFLDEIESMPMAMQVKFLRVLQERVIERLGSNQLVPVDFRVIAATKADLLALAEEGKFRADLHFRLNVATIDLPPLRARPQDIALLFDTFVHQAALRVDRPAPPIKDAVIRELLAHKWPGNVRELRNQAERFVLGLKGAPGSTAGAEAVSLTAAVEAFERGLIVEELRRNQGNLSRTAEAMQIPKTTLFGKIRKYDIREQES
ncbi:sigma-54 dependent transcriptional regulator [Trinickia caryophylli]|uniref:Two-component system, NtrC family, C4-dicarboxylate transport response regulator DctD n=1 Tax=Trinickia caryophylli TaxID=28094 RepID=A0A1X7FN89_TRICW|nr:sigma-54 dependent transcriptional regulator [Trinickia caryophylli]PMS13837.1 sigma-54-dependent Fis family transcriptional regulator [Trinickia caryophylli]TRX14332.1 sigma-54-dependent Fis family transcriptional regulator [Trinickia caryophylli]WQE14165.1 sigma-54 dependent transcriptional regulator [Trinickia caryophylli]SMF55043.1 two-component system, NtrC family, C4-dicarboxylate transport response regulator DctD [Trinickia caryophylli]